jgi:hypothetical protein
MDYSNKVSLNFTKEHLDFTGSFFSRKCLIGKKDVNSQITFSIEKKNWFQMIHCIFKKDVYFTNRSIVKAVRSIHPDFPLKGMHSTQKLALNLIYLVHAPEMIQPEMIQKALKIQPFLKEGVDVAEFIKNWEENNSLYLNQLKFYPNPTQDLVDEFRQGLCIFILNLAGKEELSPALETLQAFISQEKKDIPESDHWCNNQATQHYWKVARQFVSKLGIEPEKEDQVTEERILNTAFHGTNTAHLASFKRVGPSSSERIYDKDKLSEILAVYGHFMRIPFVERDQNRFYATGNANLAMDYAHNSPEWTSLLFGKKFSEFTREEFSLKINELLEQIKTQQPELVDHPLYQEVAPFLLDLFDIYAREQPVIISLQKDVSEEVSRQAQKKANYEKKKQALDQEYAIKQAESDQLLYGKDSPPNGETLLIARIQLDQEYAKATAQLKKEREKELQEGFDLVNCRGEERRVYTVLERAWVDEVPIYDRICYFYP